MSTSRAHRAASPRTRTAVRRGPALVQPVEPRLLMAGQLDPSWNGAGKLSIAPPAGSVALTSLTTVQQDERVVVAGVYRSASSGALAAEVVRYTAQGTLDSTFNGGAPVTLGFTPDSLFLENDGRIIVSGPSIERINADGTVDTTFGTNGIVPTPFGLASVTEDGSGQIYAAGDDSAGTGRVIRYTATGAVDTTFGNNGQTTIAIAGGGAATYKLGQVLLTPGTQTPVVTFSSAGNPSLVTFGAVRLTTAGVFDTTFGLGGVAETAGYGIPGQLGGMAITTSGVIYQAVTTNYGSTGGVGYFVAISGDGKYDRISPTGGLNTFASGVTLSLDNKPIIVGTGVQGTGASTHTVITLDRFDAVDPAAPVFTPDATFGGTGLITVAYQGANAQDNASVGDLGFAAVAMPNGNIVLAGTSLNGGTDTTSTFNLTRIIGDGSIAASVGTITGLVFTDNDHSGTFNAGDTLLTNQTISLEGTGGNLIRNITSDATGRYTFNGLIPQTYLVVQTLSSGTHTTPTTAATATFSVAVAAGVTTNDSFGIAP